jgi:hypothetical protein
MNDQCELTTVISHLPDGRIHQFVKTPIRLAEAEQMRVKALVAAEEFKAKALLEHTGALLEKAHAPRESAGDATSKLATASAARPVPQQRVAPRAAPAASPDDVVPARDAVVPARVVAAAAKKRKEQDAQLATLRREHETFVAQAKTFISKRTREIATYVGTGVGRAFMQKALDSIPADTPPTAKVSVDGKSLEAAMQSTYKQLVEYKYCPTVTTREFAQTFAEAFMLGVREAAAVFQSTPRHYPPHQAADAGATQDDKLTCQTEQ